MNFCRCFFIISFISIRNFGLLGVFVWMYLWIFILVAVQLGILDAALNNIFWNLQKGRRSTVVWPMLKYYSYQHARTPYRYTQTYSCKYIMLVWREVKSEQLKKHMVFFLLLAMAPLGWDNCFYLSHQSCVNSMVMYLKLTCANWSSAAFLCSGFGSMVARNSSVNFCASISMQVVVQFAGFDWLFAQTEKLPLSTHNLLEFN